MVDPIDFDRLWEYVASSRSSASSSIHGLEHWRRVERNGLFLAERTGANVMIIRLFALFHDSQRWDDGSDPDHGARGAAYAKSLRGILFDLDDDTFASLDEACVWHTDGLHHDDPTIGTCWDADRLDLGRVGITPEPSYMSTAFGCEVATTGAIGVFLRKQSRVSMYRIPPSLFFQRGLHDLRGPRDPVASRLLEQQSVSRRL